MASGMMIALWVVTIAAWLAVFLLWRRTRRLGAQLDQLSHRYWELKYEQQELHLQLRGPGAAPRRDPLPPPPPARAGEAFVPLASLKR